ncbi:hypothetical protein H5410_001801, partial [Solanum commersonii]
TSVWRKPITRYQTSVISTYNTLSTVFNNHFYRCYNYNDTFHITFIIDMSFFFRCPSCFYHQVLNNYTIILTIVKLIPRRFSSTQLRSPTLTSFIDSPTSVKSFESSKNCPICRRNLRLIQRRVNCLVRISFTMIVLSHGLLIIILVPFAGINCRKKMKKKLKTICKVFWMVKLLIQNFKLIILIRRKCTMKIVIS